VYCFNSFAAASFAIMEQRDVHVMLDNTASFAIREQQEDAHVMLGNTFTCMSHIPILMNVYHFKSEYCLNSFAAN
jgi:hypothetical protein